MYPRNAESPERIAIGIVVQISDGAMQTSDVAVRILPQGGVEGDGAGTVSYSTDGVVCYTPTQAETNYTSFILIAKKAGCYPAEKTIVTSASDVPGTVDVEKIKRRAVTDVGSGNSVYLASSAPLTAEAISEQLMADFAAQNFVYLVLMGA